MGSCREARLGSLVRGARSAIVPGGLVPPVSRPGMAEWLMPTRQVSYTIAKAWLHNLQHCSSSCTFDVNDSVGDTDRIDDAVEREYDPDVLP